MEGRGLRTWRRSRGRQSHRAEKAGIEKDRKRDWPGTRENREGGWGTSLICCQVMRAI
jgi:hypothetical protein